MGSQRHRSLRATPWDDSVATTPTQRLISNAVADAYDEHHRPIGPENDAELVNSVVPTMCPRCRSADFKSDGTSPYGIRLYRCHACRRQFTPVTGTVLESRGLPLAEICAVVRGLLGFQSISSVARATVHTRKTVRYVLQRVFAAIDGVQDGLVLSRCAWADETYFPVRERDKVRDERGRLPRGHGNCDCICVAVGGGGSLFLHAGVGDQTAIELERVYGPHLEEGLVLYHDSNPAHNLLVRKRGLKDARVVGAEQHAGPEDLNVLAPVDRRCDTVQRWLSSHRGFDRAHLQDWLNLLWVMENVGDDPLEQVEFIVNASLGGGARTRVREMYGSGIK